MIQRLRLNWILLALISGMLLPFAFAPTGWFFLAFLCPAMLLFIWNNCNRNQAFLYGLVFGCGFFGVGCSWVFVSIHHYGNAGFILAVFITVVFVLILSIYIALLGYIYQRFFSHTKDYLHDLIAFPALWVSFEWLRAWLFSGFPWLLLGYSQTATPLKFLAPIVSVYGVSLAVALIAGLLVWLFKSPTNTRRISTLISIIILFGISYSFKFIQWTIPYKTPLTASLVQGNIPLKIKWDAGYLTHILAVYTQQTHQHWNSDIIVWPEAAIPVVSQQVLGFLYDLKDAALVHHAAVIFGIPTYNDDETAYYNSMRVLGDGSGHYNKRHLVPFGEYTPLQALFKPLMDRLNIPMSGFSAGNYSQPLLSAKGIKIAPYICYEIAFAHEVLATTTNSNLIVVISDDSWFGNSFASPQQLQMAQLRALETGRPILYSTNNGITAVINYHGNITQHLPRNKRLTLTAIVQPRQGETLAMRWHNLLIGLIVLLMLIISFKKRKH